MLIAVDSVLIQSFQAECIKNSLGDFEIKKINHFVNPNCIEVAFTTKEGERIQQLWHAIPLIDGFWFLKETK